MESVQNGTGVRERLAAAGTTLRNPDLARLMVSWGCWMTGDWGVLIAMSVVAFDRGGAVAVGLVGAVRVLPGAVLGPLASVLSDRRRRPRMLATVHGAWCLVALTLAVLSLARAPLAALLGALAAGSVVAAVVKPCVNALVPQLVRGPHELVAGNAAYSLLEATGTVAGPLLAGLLLAAAGPTVTLTVLAAVFSPMTHQPSAARPDHGVDPAADDGAPVEWWRSGVSFAEARAESWVALSMAAGQPPPTSGDWRMLGVPPHPAQVPDDAEFAYGVWRTLSWLLGVREDMPIFTSWHRAAGEPPDRPHLLAPLRGGEPDAAWFAAERAAQDQARTNARRYWRHIRAQVDAAAAAPTGR